MRPCAQFDFYCDGELDSAGRAAFESHLETCEECAGRVAGWAKIRRELGLIARENEAAIAASSESGAQRLVEQARRRTPRRQRFAPILRPAFAFAAAVAVLAASFVLFRALGPKPSNVKPIQGPIAVAPVARLFHLGEPQSVAFAASLGAPIDSPADGRVLLRLGRDEIGMGPQTRIAIRKASKEITRIELERGAAVFLVSTRNDRGEFFVQTDDLSVRVVGTAFAVSRENGKTSVAVMKGSVQATPKDEGVYTIKAGERLSGSATVAYAVNPLDNLEAAAYMSLLSWNVAEKLQVEAPEVARETDLGQAKLTAEKSRDAQLEKPLVSLATWRQWVIDGRLEEAERALKSHLEQMPKDVDAWSLLADCGRKTGDWTGAVEAYRNVIALAPAGQAQQAKFRAGALLQDKLGNYRAAIELFDSYVNSGRGDNALSAEALLRLAQSHLAVGNREKAIELLDVITSRHRGSSAAVEARQLIEEIGNGD